MKRLMALIALASSTSLAQQQPGDGNVPLPDLFDSQIACTSQLPRTVPTPTVVAEGAMESVLDAAIGIGNFRIGNTRLIVNDLGYVIPSLGSNCGMGIGHLAFTASGQGSVAKDMAEGYSALLPKFMVVYGDPDSTTRSGTRRREPITTPSPHSPPTPTTAPRRTGRSRQTPRNSIPLTGV